MTVRPAFVFLREDGESNNDAVARCAFEATAAGPMGRSVRQEDYRSLIEAGFAVDTPAAPVFSSSGTHCAIFVRACLACAGVKPRGRRPVVTGVTSWLGVGWFREPEWVPIDELEVAVGDVLYWCGYPGMRLSQWRAASNGHVGIATSGGGWSWKTAEGGGGGDGSVCRTSPIEKSILSSWSRPLRGVWRPDNMVIPGLGT